MEMFARAIWLLALSSSASLGAALHWHQRQFPDCPPSEWLKFPNGTARSSDDYINQLQCPTHVSDLASAHGWRALNVNVSPYPYDWEDGYAFVDNVTGDSLRLVCGGHDIWGYRDSGFFLLRDAVVAEQPVFSIVGTVVDADFSSQLSQWVKSGLVVRQSDDPGAAYVIVWWGQGLNGIGRVMMQYRPTYGNHTRPLDAESTFHFVDDVPLPCELRLQRIGDLFHTSYRTSKSLWIPVNSFSLPGLFNGSTFVWGLAGTSVNGISGVVRPWSFVMSSSSIQFIPTCDPPCDVNLAKCNTTSDEFPVKTGRAFCQCLADGSSGIGTGSGCPDLPPLPLETTSSVGPPSPPLVRTNSISSEPGSSSLGLVLGIAAAIFFCVLILIFVVLLWKKRHEQQNYSPPSVSPHIAQGQTTVDDPPYCDMPLSLGQMRNPPTPGKKEPSNLQQSSAYGVMPVSHGESGRESPNVKYGALPSLSALESPDLSAYSSLPSFQSANSDYGELPIAASSHQTQHHSRRR